MAKKVTRDLEFEIGFFEGVVRNRPQFREALSALGDTYTKAGRFEDGLIIDQRLASLYPDDPVVLYNLACSYALLKKTDQAFEAMQMAIEKGYQDFEFLLQDRDLTNLLADRRFREYLSKLRQPQGPMSHENVATE